KNGIASADRMLRVPDVKNLSLRKAINTLLTEGFEVDINGSGKILEQFPAAGTSQLPRSRIILYCKNQ
ncbi:MAG: PASTA domain-containing protein, partial [Bacteroidota bacterium]|nr:PASTA domain-containing protein [Bacteroidota bacterium]